MKHLKSILLTVAVAALGSQAASSQVVFDGTIDLVGFSGGTCNISVDANTNASNLNLDNPEFGVEVGVVNTQCDYDHRIVVTAETNQFGEFALTHSEDSFATVRYEVDVDGFLFGFSDPSGFENELPPLFPGESRQMPVRLNVFDFAPISGIYQGSVTFSLIVD